ncbi:hypothetical protein QQF64_023549 [Cirrhinus molitorella]|uniref:Uncharacterized protein n=1 Tax=Cirrhinus molitorella TaxID=172907 RepID=A0ABR3NJL3_9TELE
MAFIKEESEDIRIEEVFSLKQEDTEEQTDLMGLKEEIGQETCNSIEPISVAKKPKWNLGVKELVFLCNCLGLPNLTGRHLGSSREKC